VRLTERVRHTGIVRGDPDRGDPDRGCFRSVSVVSPIVMGFDPQRDAYRGLDYSQCSSMPGIPDRGCFPVYGRIAALRSDEVAKLGEERRKLQTARWQARSTTKKTRVRR
jgi:hypothetical protein